MLSINSTTPTATKLNRPLTKKMKLIAVLLSITIVISHGMVLNMSTTAADGLQETTKAEVEETRSLMSGNSESVRTIDLSILC
nr:hypothetical transcript [Hymenolepis microstoma]